MNKEQKEVLEFLLDEEKKTLNELKKAYKSALDDINFKLNELMSRQDADMQHVIYQMEYQKALKSQVQGILEKLHSDEFDVLTKYLTDSYTHGFVGTMYDFAGQGIPLITPIDQHQMIDAILNETKLKEKLYESLGHDIKALQKTISAEISRGIATGLAYNEIARNLKSSANIPLNRAMTIARTESHRINCKASYDAQEYAKSRGADVVKQWDASLDGATRPTHRLLDGQIRELKEPFEAGGKKAMYPGGFGEAGEDCNCRCSLLQRATWALDDEELEALREKARYHGTMVKDSKEYGHSKAKDFSDYMNKYLKAAESERVRIDAQKMKQMSNSFRPEFSNSTKGIGVKFKDANNQVVNVEMNLKKVKNSQFNMYVDEDAQKRNKAVRLTEKNLEKIKDKLPEGYKDTTIAVVDFKKYGFKADAIAAYYSDNDTVLINAKYDTSNKILDYVNKIPNLFANQTEYAPYLHEFGHKHYEDTVKSLANKGKMSYNKAKEIIDSRIYDFVHDNKNAGAYFVRDNISIYADLGFDSHDYTEIIAECWSTKGENEVADALLEAIRGE